MSPIPRLLLVLCGVRGALSGSGRQSRPAGTPTRSAPALDSIVAGLVTDAVYSAALGLVLSSVAAALGWGLSWSQVPATVAWAAGVGALVGGAFGLKRGLGADREELSMKLADSVRPAVRDLGPRSRWAVAALGDVIARADDPYLVRDAIEAAGRLGPRATGLVGVLSARLGDPDLLIRHEAARALCSIGEVARGEASTSALDELDPIVRAQVVEELGSLGTGFARPLSLLDRALLEGGEDAVDEAAVALGEGAVPALIQAAGTREYFARSRAISALGRHGDGRAVEFLTARLDDPGLDLVDRLDAVRALAGLGASARPALAVLTRALDDPWLAWHAAEAIGSIGSAGAQPVSALMRLTNRGSPIDRAAVAWALWRVTGVADHAIAVLTRLLGTPGQRRGPDDSDAAAAAAERLGRVGAAAAPAVPVLTAMVHNDAGDVAIVAARVLGRLGPDAAAAAADLEAFLRSAPQVYYHDVGSSRRVRLNPTQDSRIRIEAALAHAQILGDAWVAVESLRELIDPNGPFCAIDDGIEVSDRRPDGFRANVAAALGSLGPAAAAAVPELQAAAADGSDALREAATRALRAVRG